MTWVKKKRKKVLNLLLKALVWLPLFPLIFVFPQKLSSMELYFEKKFELNVLFRMVHNQEKVKLNVENREDQNDETRELKMVWPEESQEEAQPEIIFRPKFKNIKEEIGVYVFLGWLWLIIAVLLYVLNQQIKEADRRRHLGL